MGALASFPGRRACTELSENLNESSRRSFQEEPVSLEPPAEACSPTVEAKDCTSAQCRGAWTLLSLA